MIEKELISLTPEASRQIRAIIDEKGLPPFYGLRVGLKGAACGASYLLGFDTENKDEDDHFEVEGIPVFVNRRHLMYLIGVTIDFEEGGEGFVFRK
ncbi:HesB/IscA family protein [Siphonobacter aquaeclarae]|uniref:Iron-sulfur cluster assembly protein n=1 Tax=Siphonobacter aquaeclarae TaxID=563176 RepID=A0A1G9T3H8_9BACT|nr:iron-sulfur cluster assembly accessory protein [Siphonobacter aquaeclarae]SDM42186.1 iron-sulfur cluster assembly protein [Siphonobacter aquaeclarae]